MLYQLDKDEFAWYDMAVGQRSTKLSYMQEDLLKISHRLKRYLDSF